MLHAGNCIERGLPWQAEYWISTVRDHAITLACIRLGYPTSYATGADRPAAAAALRQTLLDLAGIS